MKHIERIKKIIAWAYEMRFIDRNVFASFKVRKTEFESPILHWQQLEKLQHKIFQVPMLNLVKDLFVFCCFTGLAPIDLQNLKHSQIYKDADGLTWLTYKRTKSKIQANVPLLNPAIVLLEKYRLQKGEILRNTVFPFVTNKDLNTNLKIISEICELGIPLNFYIARHTIATTVTLLNGVPVTSIKGMMGHRKIESTMHYAKINKDVIARDMNSLNEKLKMLHKTE
ncbi:MAG TPA: site-specific integrase [Puia sp.]|nr:site-specific integrase [Puia sp.]